MMNILTDHNQLQVFLSHLFVNTPYSKLSKEYVEVPDYFIHALCLKISKSIRSISTGSWYIRDEDPILLKHLQFLLSLYNASSTIFYHFFSVVSMFPSCELLSDIEFRDNTFYTVLYNYSCIPKEIVSLDQLQLGQNSLNAFYQHQTTIQKNYSILIEFLSAISFYLYGHSYNLTTINYISWLLTICSTHKMNMNSFQNDLISDIFLFNITNIAINVSFKVLLSQFTSSKFNELSILRFYLILYLDIQNLIQNLSFLHFSKSISPLFQEEKLINSDLYDDVISNSFNRSTAQQFLLYLLQYYISYQPNELNLHTTMDECSTSLLYQYLSDKSMLHPNHAYLWWSVIASKTPYSKFRNVLHLNNSIPGQFVVPKSYFQLLHDIQNSDNYLFMKCSVCQCELTNDYYKCLNCKNYNLCPDCEQQETSMVYLSYKNLDDFALSCIHDIYSPTSTSFQLHDSYTHVFTHIFVDIVHTQGINDTMNSFPSIPILPPYYDKEKPYYVDTDYLNYLDDSVFNDISVNDPLSGLSSRRSRKTSSRHSSEADSISSQNSGNQSPRSDSSSFSRYSFASLYSTMSTSAPKKTSAALQIIHQFQKEQDQHKGKNQNSQPMCGFIHLYTKCSFCKKGPIVGVRYICLNCSCELCEECYHQDITLGQGICSHGLGHMMIRIVHPILPNDQLREYLKNINKKENQEHQSSNTNMNIEDIYHQINDPNHSYDQNQYNSMLNHMNNDYITEYSSEPLSQLDSFNILSLDVYQTQPSENNNSSSNTIQENSDSMNRNKSNSKNPFNYSQYVHFLQTVPYIKKNTNLSTSSYLYEKACSIIPSLVQTLNTIRSSRNESNTSITLSDPDLVSQNQINTEDNNREFRNTEHRDSFDISDSSIYNYFTHPIFTKPYPTVYSPSLLLHLEKKELNSYLDISILQLLFVNHVKYIKYIYEFERYGTYLPEFDYIYLQMIQSTTSLDLYNIILNRVYSSLLLVFNIDLNDSEYKQDHKIDSIYKHDTYNDLTLKQYIVKKKKTSTHTNSFLNLNVDSNRKSLSLLPTQSNPMFLLSTINEFSSKAVSPTSQSPIHSAIYSAFSFNPNILNSTKDIFNNNSTVNEQSPNLNLYNLFTTDSSSSQILNKEVEESPNDQQNHSMITSKTVLTESHFNFDIQYIPLYIKILPISFIDNLLVLSGFLIRKQSYSRLIKSLKEGTYDSLFLFIFVLFDCYNLFGIELFTDVVMIFLSILDCYCYSYKQDTSLSLSELKPFPMLYDIYTLLFQAYVRYNTFEYEPIQIFDKKWSILDKMNQLYQIDSSSDIFFTNAFKSYNKLLKSFSNSLCKDITSLFELLNSYIRSLIIISQTKQNTSRVQQLYTDITISIRFIETSMSILKLLLLIPSIRQYFYEGILLQRISSFMIQSLNLYLASPLMNINPNIKKLLEIKMKYTSKFFIYKYCEVFLILSKYSMSEKSHFMNYSQSEDPFFLDDTNSTNTHIVPSSIPENEFFVSLIRVSDHFVINNFLKVIDILQEIETKTNTFIQQFMNSIEILKCYYYENQKSSIDIDVIPPEFLDPLLNTLMIDPVRLPCGIVCDRSVILRHLMEHTTDPFTRQYLNEDMLVEDTELRNKIVLFIQQQQEQKNQIKKTNL